MDLAGPHAYLHPSTSKILVDVIFTNNAAKR